MTENDDKLQRASDALRAKLQGPGAAFTGRVMEQVRREPKPRRVPRGIEIPRWSIPLAAAAAVLLYLAGAKFGVSYAPRTTHDAPVAAASSRADTVYVRFELAAPTAHAVHLAGDFSGWQPSVPLTKDANGKWVATLPVAVGVHRYQFVVDDAWIADPASGSVDDGFGGRNSVVVVGPKGVVRS